MDNNHMYYWLLPVCCNKMLGDANQDSLKLMEQDALKKKQLLGYKYYFHL